MKVNFTKDEANKLMDLVDLAVKAHGLEVAGLAFHFYEKFNDLFNEEEELKNGTRDPSAS